MEEMAWYNFKKNKGENKERAYSYNTTYAVKQMVESGINTRGINKLLDIGVEKLSTLVASETLIGIGGDESQNNIVLNKPSKYNTMYKYIYAVAKSIITTGDALTIIKRDIDGSIIGLQLIHNGYNALYDDITDDMVYRVTYSNGQVYEYGSEEVLHMYIKSDDLLQGKSSIQGLDMYNAIINTSLNNINNGLKSNGIKGRVKIANSLPLEEEERQKMSIDINTVVDKYNIVYLPDGVEIEEFNASGTSKIGDGINSYNIAVQAVASSLGLSAEDLGSENTNSSSEVEAERLSKAIKPYLKAIEDEYNAKISPITGSTYKYKVSDDKDGG